MPEDEIVAFAASTGAHGQELDSAARDFDFNLQLDDAPCDLSAFSVSASSVFSPLAAASPRMASTNRTAPTAAHTEAAVTAPELLSPSHHPPKSKQPTSQRKLSVLGALGLGMNMGIGPKIMLQHMRHQQNQQNQHMQQTQLRSQRDGTDSAPFASPVIGRGRSASMAFPSSSSSSSSSSTPSSSSSSSSSSVLSPLGKRFRAQSVFATDFPAHLDSNAAMDGMLSVHAAVDTAALTPTAAVLRQQQAQLQYLERLQSQLRTQWRATAAAVAAHDSNTQLSQGSANHAVGDNGMQRSAEDDGCGEAGQPQQQQQSQLSPDEAAAEQACLSSTGGEPWQRVTRPGAHLFKLLVVGNSKCGKSSLIQRYTRDAFSENYAVTVGSDFSRKQLQWDEETSIRVNLWDVAGQVSDLQTTVDTFCVVIALCIMIFERQHFFYIFHVSLVFPAGCMCHPDPRRLRQDRFATLTRPFFAGAAGAIVVCDVTRPASLDAAKMWKLELDDRLADCRIPVILVANKSDLLQGGTKSFATGARVAKLAQDCGFAGWFVASAKENANITLGVEFLLNEVLRAQQQQGDNEAENVAMSKQPSATIDLTALPPAAVSSYGCC